MNNIKSWIEKGGLAALGIALTIMGNIVANKRQDEAIKKAVKEEVEEQLNETEGSN